MNPSRLLSVYTRAVDGTVAWLSPQRLKVYPTAVGVITLLTWVVSQALGPGLTDLSHKNIGLVS